MGASTRKMAARRTNMGMMTGTWEEKRGMYFLQYHLHLQNLKFMHVLMQIV